MNAANDSNNAITSACVMRAASGANQPISASQKLSAYNVPPRSSRIDRSERRAVEPNRSLARPHHGLATKNTMDDAAMMAPTWISCSRSTGRNSRRSQADRNVDCR